VILMSPAEEHYLNLLNDSLEIKIDRGEFFRFLNVLLVASAFNLPRNCLWEQADDTYGLFPTPNIVQLMSKHRFYSILSAIDGKKSDDVHIWKRTSDWIEEVCCAARNRIRSMPDIYVFDESMVGFRGISASKYAYENGVLPPGASPGVQKVIRKPVPIGFEMRTGAVMANENVEFQGLPIIVQAEFVSYPKPMPEIDNKLVSKSTASILRGSWFLRGSHKSLIGDAGYGSVSTCISLLEIGIFSVLSVKTHCKSFPKENLNEILRNKSVGSHAALVVKIPSGHQIIALAWRANCNVTSYYVASFGSTLPGEPATKLRWSVEQKRYVAHPISRPQIVELYHAWYNIVDRANKLRQNGFRLEATVSKWKQRLFMYGWSQIVSNAYSLFHWDKRKSQINCSRRDFTKQLVLDIYKFFKLPNLYRAIRTRNQTQEALNDSYDIPIPNYIRSYDDLNPTSTLRMCSICKCCRTRVLYYCDHCKLPYRKIHAESRTAASFVTVFRGNCVRKHMCV
jgi:hypothetical protein